MAVRRRILGITLFLASAAPFHVAYAADYIESGSARSSSYQNSYVRYSAEDCSNLLIIDDSGRRVVRLCHPPVNLDPRGNFEPGSSGGTSITYSSSSTVVN